MVTFDVADRCAKVNSVELEVITQDLTSLLILLDPRTDGILHKLYTYTVTRGILLTIVQVLSLIVYVAQPEKLTWYVLWISFVKRRSGFLT